MAEMMQPPMMDQANGMMGQGPAAGAAQQLPAAAGHLDRIRRLVALNLVLGVLTIATATLGRGIF